MKVKLIDLLVKIANQDEPPKKIKWNYHVYIYDEQYDDYYEETTALFENEMSNGMLFKSLNDYVEIIEEKPKEIENWTKFAIERINVEAENIESLKEYLITTINTQKEIIDGLNYLLKKEDEP